MKSKVISCVVSGIEKRVSGMTINKMSLKFGNLEQFENHFVCREAKQLLRQRIPPDQVQMRLLPNGKKPFSIDMHVLARLKLLKKSRKGKEELSAEERFKQEEQSKENERKYYEHKEKMTTCLKTWVEWATGGPNKCQVPYGGTCIRPDVYYDNDESCGDCPYYEHCLCRNKNK